MNFQPKPISEAGVPAALQKAERYRVINDPTSAESICLDVLTVSPENQQALVTLLLAITDQFGAAPTEGVRRAREVLPRLQDEYKRAYYAGIIAERCAKAQLRSGAPKAGKWPTIGSVRRWAGTRRRRRSGRRETTKPSSAGTPADGCWLAIRT